MPSRLFLSPPQLSGEELPLVHEAFASNDIAPVGPMVDAFEDVLAAIGRGQLRALDDRVRRKRELFAFYEAVRLALEKENIER